MRYEETYFPNVFIKISEILTKNGIEESLVEAMFKEEKSFIGTTFRLMKDFAEEKISEKDFCSSLQTQLNVSKETSENILKEIKTNILPYAEKIKIGEQVNKNAGEPIIAKPIRLINGNQTITERPALKEIEKNPIKEKVKLTKNVGNPPEEKEIKYPKEPDKYREPIG